MYTTKKYYEANKQYYKDKAKLRKAKIRDLINTIKSTPCADCGISYPPYVMDFDHRENKLDNVAKLVGNMVAFQRILDEVSKCDVVCANCHRIRTYG